MKVKYILTLATLLLSLSAFAQRGKFFTTDHQLSSSFVTQVYLDNEGFIWTTTRNGINRYDGYQFRVFKKENEHDSSLASNYVNSMMQDRKGLFYFGMYGALQTWDGTKFHNRQRRSQLPQLLPGACQWRRTGGNLWLRYPEVQGSEDSLSGEGTFG